MINRELTEREKEILEMIRPTTFRDIVDAVRKDIEQSKYDAKRGLRNLHNGITNGTMKEAMSGIVCTTNGEERVNNIGGKACEVLI